MSDDDVVGLVGRISCPIAADGPGEIVLPVRGGSTTFTAYTSDGEELKKNAHAVVIEQTGPHTVMVTATGA